MPHDLSRRLSSAKQDSRQWWVPNTVIPSDAKNRNRQSNFFLQKRSGCAEGLSGQALGWRVHVEVGFGAEPLVGDFPGDDGDEAEGGVGVWEKGGEGFAACRLPPRIAAPPCPAANVWGLTWPTCAKKNLINSGDKRLLW